LHELTGVDRSALSGLMKWEAPDPAFWCAQGYAICNPDSRGVGKSTGDIQFFGEQEGLDAHDYIEWVAVQPWCSGKVGMAGNSWLAISQWFAASTEPPHLAAIAPWEGFIDVYRDHLAVGGIPDLGFAKSIIAELCGSNGVEEPGLAFEQNPLLNDYWKKKAAKVDRIRIPAYVAASYSNTVHTPGTFRGWQRLASEQKWLRIHNSIEWPDFYDRENTLDLLRFFDHFLKGKKNGWEQTPRVRYSLLDLERGDVINVPARQFPPEGVVNVPYYLDLSSSSLVTGPVKQSSKAYAAESDEGRLEFTLRFPTETRIVGYPRLRLWVEAEGHDDMDLFALMQKLDRDGNHLTIQTSGRSNPVVDELTKTTGSVLKFKAVPGKIRVSARKLDPEFSTPDVPVLKLDQVEKLKPGQIVDVDIALFPTGLLMHPGEQLRLIVTGRNLIGSPMPFVPIAPPDNRGRHIIHSGGKYDSQLVLPVLKPV
jgi:predicted acyl esterase